MLGFFRQKSLPIFLTNPLCLIFALACVFFPLFSFAEQAEEIVVAEEQVDIESTAFDLFLRDRFVGIVPVNYSLKRGDTWMEIIDPQDAIEILEDIKPGKKKKILKLLSGKLTERKDLPNVGTLEFNLETFRITLTLNSNILRVKELDELGEIVRPESRSALRQDLHVTAVDGRENLLSINSLSLLSMGKAWAELEFTKNSGSEALIQRQDTVVQDANLNFILDEYQFSTGLFETRGDRLIPTFRAAGLSLVSSAQILNNDSLLRGNSFQVFVPTRSRVDFFRGSLLIDSQVLNSGLQEVDTTRFPQGSYFVDVVIQEIAGGSTRQRVFFTKSGLLAPRGHPTVFFQAGVLRDAFDIDDVPVGVGGIRWRALDSLQLEAAAFGVDDITAGVFGFRGLAGDSIFGTALSYSSEQDVGVSLDLSANMFGLNFGGYYEKSSFIEVNNTDDPFTLNEIPDPSMDFLMQNAVTLREGETYSLFLVKRIGNLELRLDSFEVEDQETGKFFYRGPGIRYNFWHENAHQISCELSYLDTQDGNRAFAYLAYRYQNRPWSVDPQVFFIKDEQRSEAQIVNALNYDTLENYSNLGARTRLRNELRSQKDNDLTVNSFEGRFGNRYFGSNVFVQHLHNFKNKDSNGFSGSATFDSSATINSDGDVSFSPAGLGESLIVVDIEGKDDDALMDVILNGTPASLKRRPGTIVLGVTPFRKYRVAVRPSEGSPIIDYDSTVKEFTLYPGGIARARFEVKNVFIALGRLVDPQGIPLGLKRIKGASNSVLTETDGFFQLEISGTEKLFIESKDVKCEIELPQLPSSVEYFYEFGDVVCK